MNGLSGRQARNGVLPQSCWREMSESKFVRHIPCSVCGSSDAAAEYDDGHTHCFSCGHTAQAEKEKPAPVPDSFRPMISTASAPNYFRNLSKSLASTSLFSISTTSPILWRRANESEISQPTKKLKPEISSSTRTMSTRTMSLSFPSKCPRLNI